MSKINYNEMSVSEIKGLIREAYSALSVKIKVESITTSVNFKAGDKVKIGPDCWWKKMIGKEYVIQKVGQTRAVIMHDEKPYHVSLSFMTKVEEPAPAPKGTSKK